MCCKTTFAKEKKVMRKYLYAEGKEPIVVDECQEMDNWHDSPIDFIKTTDFGVDPSDQVKVQCLGESIEGVAACCNGLLNLSLMSFKELREFAGIHFEGAKARSKKALISQIEAKNGYSSRYS